ncbi:fibrinogen silencer-binding protein-like [Trichoplusia ni]|uniref:Regulatory protein zeste n=2 Tax=Trichoplusia ni TaxID=7111 RepID=A0A7E5WV20_TRINI|nr:fibrinogen silencer-binding protein-like [Trichoplusia ni]XP_026744146.1 fibrinogen silencer-binding protein-like [Trichoplusia ni]
MALKRERGSNFTRVESDTLIQLVLKYKNVLENKKSDAATWAEKEQCWQKIETNFNSISSVRFRSAKALKIKYDGIKRDTRKKSAAIRAETYRTGGGPSTAPVLTPSEEKVKEMILLSVVGMDSVFDSDKITETESPQLMTNPNIIDENSRNFTEFHQSEPVVVETIEMPDETLLIHEEPISNASCENEQKIRKLSKNNSDDADVESATKWSQWKPSSLRAKKHPALCKQKPKRPFERVAESKLEIAGIQKQILEEELENKRKQWLFEEEERQHKQTMWALERQLLQNKIDKIV